MRNTLFGLLSVVVLAAALTVGLVPTPVAEAQFASNNRSIKLRETAAGNVATPASGYASVFKDSTYGSFQVKDSGGLVHGIMGKVPITDLAVATTLTAAHLGEVVVFDGTVTTGLALPEITASNIGMHYEIIGYDADDLIVTCNSNDRFVDATDAVVDADDSITASTVGAHAIFIAVNATTWIVIPTGSWAIDA